MQWIIENWDIVYKYKITLFNIQSRHINNQTKTIKQKVSSNEIVIVNITNKDDRQIVS